MGKGSVKTRRPAWRRNSCRGCGALVRYGRTYCPACEVEIYVDEAILAPQSAESLCSRRAVGEARQRDTRSGKLREE